MSVKNSPLDAQYLTVRTAALPLSEGTWAAIASTLRLSARELEVVQGVCNGGTEAAIAMQLGVSAHTVHSHLDRVYKKTGVSSRAELVVRVFSTYLRLTADREGLTSRETIPTRLA